MISVLISLLLTLRGLVRSRIALHLEVLALRHQLQVLQRSRPRRLRLMRADRWLWAWLSTSWPAWRTTLVMPETVVAWHRQGFRWYWTWKSRGRLRGESYSLRMLSRLGIPLEEAFAINPPVQQPGELGTRADDVFGRDK